MIYGLLQFSWWQYLIATLVVTHITITGVTIFLHRNQAHRALDLHPIVSHFFRFLVVADYRYGDKRMGCDSS